MHISDEAEMYLRGEHVVNKLEELNKIFDTANSRRDVADAADRLRSMGFQIILDPCNECMFYVRGGMIPRLKTPNE